MRTSATCSSPKSARDCRRSTPRSSSTARPCSVWRLVSSRRQQEAESQAREDFLADLLQGDREPERLHAKVGELRHRSRRAARARAGGVGSRRAASHHRLGPPCLLRPPPRRAARRLARHHRRCPRRRRVPLPASRPRTAGGDGGGARSPCARHSTVPGCAPSHAARWCRGSCTEVGALRRMRTATSGPRSSRGRRRARPSGRPGRRHGRAAGVHVDAAPPNRRGDSPTSCSHRWSNTTRPAPS